jgi:DNA (cytosine-5)-methyltransferase 1
MNELALFAGAGGGILGGKLLGWRTVCAVEWEPYPASVLLARQNDGILPPFPIWDDVQTFDGRPWRGIVDVVSGGFPCQDISVAGGGKGIEGERSGMWREMARIIHEIRPKFAFVENSPMLTSRGLGVVLGDLASMGFDAKWGVLGAADIGANHQRDRIWIVGTNMAYAKKLLGDGSNNNAKIGLERKTQSKFGNYCRSKNMGNTKSTGFSSCLEGQGQGQSWRASIGSAQWWQIEPPLDRVVDGMADRVDRLKAIGNGQVPLCAATAWKILSKHE